MKCLIVCYEKNVDLIPHLVKLNRTTLRTFQTTSYMFCDFPRLHVLSLESLKHVELFILTGGPTEKNVVLIDDVVKKFVNLKHIQAKGVDVHDLKKLKNLNSIHLKYCRSSETYGALRPLLYRQKLEKLKINEHIDGFDSVQLLAPCSSNLKFLDIRQWPYGFFDSFECEFPKLRILIARGSYYLNKDKLEYMMNNILSKCPKLRIYRMLGFRVESRSFENILSLLKQYALHHPKRKIEFSYSWDCRMEVGSDCPANLKITP